MSTRITNTMLLARLDEFAERHEKALARLDAQHAALRRSVTENSDTIAASTARLDQLCEEMRPVSEAYQNISGARRVVIWIAGLLGGAGAVLIGMREIAKFFKQL